MKTLCVLPWMTLDTLPDGSLAPCCFVEKTSRFDGQGKSLADYLASDELRHIREEMLDEKEPEACNGCYQLEKCGGHSPRQKNNENFLNLERKEAILEDRQEFIHLHLRPSNACDFACRSCSAFSSTTWNKDRMAMNPELKPLTLNLFKDGTQLEEDIHALCAKVEHLYLSGGEPALDEHFTEILRSFIGGGNLDKRNMSIQTNLSGGHLLRPENLSLLAEITELYISVSIDGIGKKGEFIREGLDFEAFIKNLRRIEKELPSATIIFTPTLSVYNVFHILELFDYLQNENLLDDSWIEMNMVNSPMALNPTILPKKIKEKIESTYKAYKAQEDTVTNALKEMLSFIKSENNESEFINFVSYTKTLDRLRDQDTFKLFPELKLGP